MVNNIEFDPCGIGSFWNRKCVPILIQNRDVFRILSSESGKNWYIKKHRIPHRSDSNRETGRISDPEHEFGRLAPAVFSLRIRNPTVLYIVNFFRQSTAHHVEQLKYSPAYSQAEAASGGWRGPSRLPQRPKAVVLRRGGVRRGL